jgi:hypothetical protein
LFAYHSYDHFKLSDLSSYDYGNDGVSLGYSHNYSTSLRGEFAVTAARYSFGTTDRQEASAAYQQDFRIEHYETTAALVKDLNDRNTLEFGGGLTWYRLDRGSHSSEDSD